jgi:putative ABC transport system ATP-binding protein
MTLVQATGLKKDYRLGELVVPAIRGVDFCIEAGAFVCFVGPSGSGKTTLLNLIGCLDRPSSGSLKVLGTEVGGLDRREAAAFRGDHIGFVFQDFNLIPVLTAYENIEFPLIMVQHWSASKRRDRIQSLLAAAGIAEQAGKRPDQLSGGQKQRVAVARALVTQPKLVLADEPTRRSWERRNGPFNWKTAASVRGNSRDRHRQTGCAESAALQAADTAYLVADHRRLDRGAPVHGRGWIFQVDDGRPVH